MSVTLHHAPQVSRASLSRGKSFCTLVWRNVTARGPLGGENIIILLHEQWYISGGWFFYEITFVFYIKRKRKKTSKTPGENPRSPYNSVVKKK